MLRRDEGMTVQDVVMVLSHHCDVPCTHLVGCLGERHQVQMLCPDAVIGKDVEGAGHDLLVLEYLTISVNEADITFAAGFDALKEFSDMLVSTGLDETVQAFGWMFAVDAFEIFSGRVNTVRLIQKPGVFAITQDEMTFLLALHFFLVKIKSWETMGRDPTVRCRVKIWHVWIWDSMVDRAIKMERLTVSGQKLLHFLECSVLGDMSSTIAPSIRSGLWEVSSRLMTMATLCSLSICCLE